jgi:Ca-activated chloride channel family protein
METLQPILDRLDTFGFAQPWWFLLLLPFLALALLRGRTGPTVAVRYSSVNLVLPIARKARGRFGGFATMLLRFLAVALLVAGLARPRVERGAQTDETEGIDIMLVLDFSYSMQEGTLDVGGKQVTYIDALRQITRDFIQKRPNDRLGIIGFAVEPYLVSPLTSDHDWVMEMLGEMKMDLGTAIGSAMVAAVDSLEQSDRKTRIMVVVTDGNNNIGISPFDAARLARSKGIRIYPVEIAANRILTPRRIAAHPLYNVAKTARGHFFQATDFDCLSSLYEHVEKLEKSLVEEDRLKAYEELYAWFVVPGLVILLLELILSQTLLRRLP